MIELEKSHQRRPQGGGTGLGEAPSDLQRRFEDQMQGHPSASDDRAEKDHKLPSPFDLLAQRSSSPPSPPHALAERDTDTLMHSLKSLVGQMMIATDSDGSRMLRIEIDPSVLPGVSVTVSQEAGAWIAEFECTVEDSFLRLARPATQMSQRLAHLLDSDTIWRVLAQGLPSPGDWQHLLQGHLDRPGMEARAAAEN